MNHQRAAGAISGSEGEAWTEDRNTTHWAENKGDKAVMVIAVDVFKP